VHTFDYVFEGAINPFRYERTTAVLEGPTSDSFFATTGERFGSAVAISRDSRVVAVSAPRGGDGTDAGVVRVYAIVNNPDEASAEQFALQQIGQDIKGWQNSGDFSNEFDLFGVSVDLNAVGTVIAIGASEEMSFSAADGGYCIILQLDETTAQWEQVGDVLVAAKPGNGFGSSVSLSSNGRFVAVGAPRASSDTSGAVRVFALDADNSWRERGQILYGDKEGARFGLTVSISSDGRYLGCAAGARMGVRPYVKVFELRSGIDQWEQLGEKIEGFQNLSDGVRISLALADQPLTITIGAPTEGNGGTNSGSVYVFRYDEAAGGVWRQVGNSLHGLLEYQFGASVDIDDFAQNIVVGAPTARSGSGMVGVYEFVPQ